MKTTFIILSVTGFVVYIYIFIQFCIFTYKGYFTKGKGRNLHLKAININIANAESDEAKSKLAHFKKVYILGLFFLYLTLIVFIIHIVMINQQINEIKKPRIATRLLILTNLNLFFCFCFRSSFSSIIRFSFGSGCSNLSFCSSFFRSAATAGSFLLSFGSRFFI